MPLLQCFVTDNSNIWTKSCCHLHRRQTVAFAQPVSLYVNDSEGLHQLHSKWAVVRPPGMICAGWCQCCGGRAGEACRGWGDTYQILLTQLPELLELLGHQQLGTPHCTADLPQDCRRHRHTCMDARTHTDTNTQCNYSQYRILQACCSTSGVGAFGIQQKRIR